MISGAHVLLFSKDPEADRGFFRDILRFRSVDAGGGWLIFKLPASEMALHPADGTPSQIQGGQLLSGAVLYLMCDDLEGQIKSLRSKNVSCTQVNVERWGIRTTIRLPSGGEIGLYQPAHATALDLEEDSSNSLQETTDDRSLANGC